MELLLGPVFSTEAPVQTPPQPMSPTGVVMEISGVTTEVRLPIYQQLGSGSTFGSFFVWGVDFKRQRWPSGFSIVPQGDSEVWSSPQGTFFKLERWLVTMYAAKWSLRALPVVLDDLAERFALQDPVPQAQPGLLLPELEAQGLCAADSQEAGFFLAYAPSRQPSRFALPVAKSEGASWLAPSQGTLPALLFEHFRPLLPKIASESRVPRG